MNNNDNVAVVVSNDNKNVTIYETINAIKNAGLFTGFLKTAVISARLES